MQMLLEKPRRSQLPTVTHKRRECVLSGYLIDPVTEQDLQNFKTQQYQTRQSAVVEALMELALSMQKVKREWFNEARKTADERNLLGNTVKRDAYRVRPLLRKAIATYADINHEGNTAAASAELLKIGLLLVSRERRLIPATITDHVQDFFKTQR